MAGLRLDRFGGQIPIASNRLLPDNAATVAINCDLESGELRPIQLPVQVRTFTTMKRAARFPDPAVPASPLWMAGASQFFRAFETPLVNDSFRRIVYIDNNGPGSPQTAYINSFARINAGNAGANAPLPLGVPRPGTAPGLGVAGGTAPTVLRAYVVTFVDLFGQEGQPSDATTATGNANGTWTVTQAASVPAGRGITHWNVYRTVTASGGSATYYRVAQIPIGTGTYADSRTDTQIVTENIPLLSVLWGEAPTLEGIALMPGGFFVGWKGKDLFFSEPYRPWAWNPAYQLSVMHQIVGCGVHGDALLVLTDGRPSVVSGYKPDSLAITTWETPEPCVSANSITASPDGVFFAGRKGLMLMRASGADNITRNLISEAQWRDNYAVANLAIAQVNATQIVALSTTGQGFILDVGSERNAFQTLSNFAPVDSVMRDPYTGVIWLASGNALWQWAQSGAPYAVARWESKDFHFAQPTNFGAMRVFYDRSVDIDAPNIDSIIQQPGSVVPGGPWTDGRTSLIGYFRIGESVINESIVPGTLPPGAPAGASPWPFWYGVETSNLSSLFALNLPSGFAVYVELYADGVLRWSNYIQSGVLYRPASGFKADVWRLVILTRVPIYNVQIGNTGKDLGNA